VPASGQLSFWRLTLIVDDGFWFDTQKLQAIWHEPMTDLSTGVRLMMQARNGDRA